MSILVLGSGQLARMMALAGYPLGISVQAVDIADNKIVDPVSKQIINNSLERMIEEVNAITVEFEHIPENLLELVHGSGKLKPSVEAILTGADRVREKKLLEKLAITNCPFEVVTDVEQLEAAVEKLGEKLIIKASRNGYDGYGQWRLHDIKDLPELKQNLSKLDLNKVPLVVEKMLSFDRELSLVAVRSNKGEIAYYPLAENLHHHGQLHVSMLLLLKSTKILINKLKASLIS